MKIKYQLSLRKDFVSFPMAANGLAWIELCTLSLRIS